MSAVVVTVALPMQRKVSEKRASGEEKAGEGEGMVRKGWPQVGGASGRQAMTLSIEVSKLSIEVSSFRLAVFCSRRPDLDYVAITSPSCFDPNVIPQIQ